VLEYRVTAKRRDKLSEPRGEEKKIAQIGKGVQMRKALSVASVVLMVCVPQKSWGKTWYVDGSVLRSGDGTSWKTPLVTIQEGIDKASDGHTVIVALLTKRSYMENIHFDGKNIIVCSTNPLSHTVVRDTVIDGNKAGAVVTFSGTEGEKCALRGFTIRNGEAFCAGGISGRGSRGTIENNVITGNSATATYAGGLHMCDGLICNNIITDNSAAYYGGGFYHCNGMIKNNTISQNTALEGGGLAYCDGTIQDNIITQNLAKSNGGEAVGAGLAHCNGIIQSNTITENCSDSFGGGLAYCDNLIRNNTICDNSAFCGGGLAYCNTTIRNNTISENFAHNGGGLAYCDGIIQSNTITGNRVFPSWPVGIGGGLLTCNGKIENCIIWGNTGRVDTQIHEGSEPTYCCIQDWTGWGEGNIDQDPLFVDPDGPDNNPTTYADNDYRLQSDSPCVDNGKNGNWMWDAVDLDGHPRVFYGVSSVTVDMGAYEYNSFSFRIIGVAQTAGGGFRITWTSRPGDTFAVWSPTDGSFGTWVQQTIVTGSGTTNSWTDTVPNDQTKFYRVELTP